MLKTDNLHLRERRRRRSAAMLNQCAYTERPNPLLIKEETRFRRGRGQTHTHTHTEEDRISLL
jgi:hypothetical protein